LNIIKFPVSTAKLAGDFYNNRQSAANRCLHFAILSFPLCCANIIGVAIPTPPLGAAHLIKKNQRKFLIGAANSLRFAYWRGEGALLCLLAQGAT
jgi:hypothetical protein